MMIIILIIMIIIFIIMIIILIIIIIIFIIIFIIMIIMKLGFDLRICNYCKMKKGVGFMKYLEDCDKYVECYFGKDGKIEVEYR